MLMVFSVRSKHAPLRCLQKYDMTTGRISAGTRDGFQNAYILRHGLLFNGQTLLSAKKANPIFCHTDVLCMDPVQSEPCSNVVAHHVDAMPSTLTKQRRSDRLPEDSPKPMGQDATNHPLIYQTSSLDPQTFSWPVQPYSRFLLEL